MATIKEVAVKAGVSIATVSYVLNDSRKVRPETGQRVLWAAKELGYLPNTAARSLVERWMDWQLAALNGPYLGVFREAKKKEEERASGFAADLKELAAQLEILEKGTAGRPWLAGANFSLADICLGPIIDRVLAFPVTLPAIPGVRAWRDKVVARDAYKKSKG